MYVDFPLLAIPPDPTYCLRFDRPIIQQGISKERSEEDGVVRRGQVGPRSGRVVDLEQEDSRVVRIALLESVEGVGALLDRSGQRDVSDIPSVQSFRQLAGQIFPLQEDEDPLCFRDRFDQIDELLQLGAESAA